MGTPSADEVRRLVEWRPALGVISIYLRFDPGDRGGAWRTELRNGFAAVLEAADELDHRTRIALRATAERIGERFGNHDHDLPRGEVGFVEVALDAGGERWWSTHLSPQTGASACFAEEPVVAPLLHLTKQGAERGVALVSAERVRLLEWAPGSIDQVESWELRVFSHEWRERKAPRVADPARGQGVSAAGRDQFGERLAENRERFLAESGGIAARLGADRGWRQILVFGPPEHVGSFQHGAGSSSLPAFETAADADLISVPDGQVEARIEEATERLASERDRELVERALDETRGGDRGAAGVEETLAALDEGRVDHLVLDVARAAAACSSPLLPDPDAAPADGVASETLARRALLSSAEVSTVSGEAAELLTPVEGVVALLRY
jgi:release factor family 10